MRSEPILAGAISRDRIIIASCIVLITLLAWTHLFQLDRQMSSADAMAQMGMAVSASWTARDFLLTFAMWSVMMIGMMLPTALPVLLLFARMRAGREHTRAPVSTAMFGLGYAIVWIGFSALAATLQLLLHEAALLSSAMVLRSSLVSGAVLIAAGIYQLTPAKSKCLTKCQSPLGFLLANWREGARGALELGTRHGLYCLGCCWALMCVLFVVGVMNLAWVAALTAFILIEKFGPAGVRLARVSGVMIVALGIFTAMRS